MLDSHQHFWKVARGDYGWMDDGVAPLRRDFLPDDLRPLLRRAGVTRTIAVQAAPTEAETAFLLDLKAETAFIAGVVGWLDLDSPGFPARFERYLRTPGVVGLRPMIQDLPDGWLLRPRVSDHLALVAEAGMPLDLLIRVRQMPDAIAILRRHPGLVAVLDHLGKPDIAAGALDPWRDLVAELARHPGLHCKVSGLITEAGTAWGLDDMRPYVHHAVACFGEDRLMFGSDWPVATLAGSYADVIHVAQTALAPLVSAGGHAKVFEHNAARFYGLKPPRG